MTHPEERAGPSGPSSPLSSAAPDGPPRRPRQRETVTRTIRLVALLVVLVLAVVVVVTTVVLTGPPSRQELMEQAGLIGKRELLIGVKDDQPGVGKLENGVYSGFDIDIAHMIAADLGFRPHQVRFLAIESEDRARRRASAGDGTFATVDLVIASYSITGKREEEEGVTFSAPYLSTEQSVVTRIDYPESVDTLRDLRGKPACTLATATSAERPELEGVALYSKKSISECFDDLKAGKCEAVTTDAAILAGFVAERPEELKIHDIGDERGENWGVNTGNNEALRDLVNLTLYNSLTDPQDHRWEDAFDRHLRPLQQFIKEQPIAGDQQPDVREVEVRQWPWEKAAMPLSSPAAPGRPATGAVRSSAMDRPLTVPLPNPR